MTQNRFEQDDFSLKKIVNIPNTISMARIIASIPLSYAIFQAGFPTSTPLIALTLGFLATDYVDGFLARKLNQQTRVGQVLDPIGDKLLALGLMGSLLAHKILPLWSLIIPARDIAAVLVAKNHMTKNNQVMKPNNIARSKTAFLFVAIGTCVMFGEFSLLACTTLLASCILALCEVGLGFYNLGKGKAINDTTSLNSFLCSKMPFLRSVLEKKKKQSNSNKTNNKKEHGDNDTKTINSNDVKESLLEEREKLVSYKKKTSNKKSKEKVLLKK